MILNSLGLSDFKNYQQLQLEPCEHVNIFVGDNAQGKTNLLEGIYYLSALRSFRPLKDRELIRFGAKQATVMADVSAGNDRYRLEAVIPSEGRRAISVNGIRMRTTADMLGNLNCVLFSPEDLMLVKGASALRRRFINLSLSQLRPRYFEQLMEYNRLITRKSRMLKDLADKPALRDALLAYNQRLAETGGAIAAYRAWFINKLYNHASVIHSDIAPGERLELKYAAGADRNPSEKEGEAVSVLAGTLERGFETEMRAKTCLYGPHRDELEITLDGSPARLFASQGQSRTAALAIKLAERDIFQGDTGSLPLLLLDDLLSELDRSRQEYILKSIGRGQVFITCCDLGREASQLAGRIFEIKDGRIGRTVDP